MSVKISTPDAELILKVLEGRNEGTIIEGLVMRGVKVRLRDQLPPQFEEGDIVHDPNGTTAWTKCMEVRAVGEDGKGDKVFWCLDADGDYGTWISTDLAHGERP